MRLLRVKSCLIIIKILKLINDITVILYLIYELQLTVFVYLPEQTTINKKTKLLFMVCQNLKQIALETILTYRNHRDNNCPK